MSADDTALGIAIRVLQNVGEPITIRPLRDDADRPVAWNASAAGKRCERAAIADAVTGLAAETMPPTLCARLRTLIPAGLCRVEIEHDDDGEWCGDVSAHLSVGDGVVWCALHRRGDPLLSCTIDADDVIRWKGEPLTKAWGYPIGETLLAELQTAAGIGGVDDD